MTRVNLIRLHFQGSTWSVLDLPTSGHLELFKMPGEEPLHPLEDRSVRDVDLSVGCIEDKDLDVASEVVNCPPLGQLEGVVRTGDSVGSKKVHERCFEGRRVASCGQIHKGIEVGRGFFGLEELFHVTDDPSASLGGFLVYSSVRNKFIHFVAIDDSELRHDNKFLGLFNSNIHSFLAVRSFFSSFLSFV
jgi:hypothetical protein